MIVCLYCGASYAVEWDKGAVLPGPPRPAAPARKASSTALAAVRKQSPETALKTGQEQLRIARERLHEVDVLLAQTTEWSSCPGRAEYLAVLRAERNGLRATVARLEEPLDRQRGEENKRHRSGGVMLLLGCAAALALSVMGIVVDSFAIVVTGIVLVMASAEAFLNRE